MKLPAFDVIGDIAISEIAKGMKAGEAAKSIMENNNHIKAVYRKSSARAGDFRTRKLRLIGGEKISETIHRENGIQLKMDIKKCYFSPREGTERMRIVERVNELNPTAEMFMTFFCGIGPTPITISKKTKVKNVVGIDLNPDAIKYFKKNISINKVSNAFAILGDVKRESKKFYGKCDFVSMPLPETAWKFLPFAMKCLKPGGICFFYAFSTESDLNSKCMERIEAAAKKQNRIIKIIETRKVLPYASRIWKVRVDFKVV